MTSPASFSASQTLTYGGIAVGVVSLLGAATSNNPFATLVKTAALGVAILLATYYYTQNAAKPTAQPLMLASDSTTETQPELTFSTPSQPSRPITPTLPLSTSQTISLFPQAPTLPVTPVASLLPAATKAQAVAATSPQQRVSKHASPGLQARIQGLSAQFKGDIVYTQANGAGGGSGI